MNVMLLNQCYLTTITGQNETKINVNYCYNQQTQHYKSTFVGCLCFSVGILPIIYCLKIYNSY